MHGTQGLMSFDFRRLFLNAAVLSEECVC
jgi:hypothetical protein